MNRDLLNRIKTKIAHEPETFNMDSWHQRDTCGTAHCICGWAQTFSGISSEGSDYQNEASFNIKLGALLLGITEEQANLLFFATYWPEAFKNSFIATSLDDDASEAAKIEARKERAAITVDRINFFMDNLK